MPEKIAHGYAFTLERLRNVLAAESRHSEVDKAASFEFADAFLRAYFAASPGHVPSPAAGRAGSSTLIWKGEHGPLRVTFYPDGRYSIFISYENYCDEAYGNQKIPALARRVARMAEGNHYTCLDCCVDTNEIKEFYGVHTHVWKQAGTDGSEGMLCIGCLEERIGRTLVADDFVDAPINWPGVFGDKSERLNQRMDAAAILRRLKRRHPEIDFTTDTPGKD